MKLKKLCALLIGLTLITGASGCSNNSNKGVEPSQKKDFDISVYKNHDFMITPQELHKIMGSKDLLIYDCNKPDIYSKDHIPGAIGIGFHAFSDIIGKPGDPGWGTIKKKVDLKATLESFGIDNKKTVVFYSDVFQGPGADGRAVWQLKMAGMDNVKFLVGGLKYWKELGYETNAEVVKPVASSGIVLKDYDNSYSATKEYVYSNLGKQVLIDVRTAGEFKGSQNAGEPRGGHIKGAVNALWLDLLNKDGTPKSPEEIKSIMASIGVKPEDDFTVY